MAALSPKQTGGKYALALFDPDSSLSSLTLRAKC